MPFPFSPLGAAESGALIAAAVRIRTACVRVETAFKATTVTKAATIVANIDSTVSYNIAYTVRNYGNGGSTLTEAC